MTKQAWYTFGNHFHWVDMEWLWGYRALGDSVRDQLKFTDVTGAPGNINFDAVGYERLAAEDPDVIALLREALGTGRAEVVGSTYGQSYALFHHGESAVRQLTYGVRTTQRVLGVRPRSFWEEEFYFFPQLPQLLVDLGYEYASLFFQWTWHTPHVPSEDAPALWWRGIDGSRILTLPRGPLNLHQWPEDFDALVANPLFVNSPVPVVQQWLELLPSPDWMCRADLLVDGVKELFNRADVQFFVGTMSTVLEATREHAVERTYSMDDVFHGMSLGKNGDHGHRRSRTLEQNLLAAEAFSVLAASGGRPYPHWDAYPGWELEESWRELLAFQHHDNDACEGLCGHVGYAGLDRADAICAHVLQRALRMIADRSPGEGTRKVLLNPLGWSREVVVDGRHHHVPGFGTVVIQPSAEPSRPVAASSVTSPSAGETITVARGDFHVVIDRARGVATRVGDVSCGTHGLGGLQWRRRDVEEVFPVEHVEVLEDAVVVQRREPEGSLVRVRFTLAPEVDALDIHVQGELSSRPDPRAGAALTTCIDPDVEVAEVRHDTPYAVGAVEGRGTHLRKYPTGDWMTSPQVYEEVHNPFTGLQFIDLLDGEGDGLMWIHDGSQGFHRTDNGAWNVLSMCDPWDEGYFRGSIDARFRALPHHRMRDSERWRLAQEFSRPLFVLDVDGPPIGPPLRLPLAQVSVGSGVVATAMYRDTELAVKTSPGHVNTQAPQPVLLRLVELDGVDDVAQVAVSGTLRAAWSTNALGEVREALVVDGGRVRVPMRAHGIATVALDIEETRPVRRNLDEHREVWAQVHRAEDPTSDSR